MTEPEEPRSNRLFRERLAEVISRAPGRIVLLGVLLGLLCIVLTSQRLEFQSSRNDLISPNVPWNARFRDWLEHFPGSTDLMIVVASDPTDEERRNRATAFIRDLVPRLA